ncbi:MAG TPA: hypothetical protein EYP85_01420 [Armatimonadetes bacterium]|nr:hypothetical protein [Armatimonadota bacterium]
MGTYYATVCGLEFVAAAEVRERGKVFFTYTGPAADVLRLRAVNHLYWQVGEWRGLPGDERELTWLTEQAQERRLMEEVLAKRGELALEGKHRVNTGGLEATLYRLGRA